MLVTPRCADPLYRRAIRVSMGTVFQVPWVRLEHWTADLQQVKDAGFLTAAMALEDDSLALDELGTRVRNREGSPCCWAPRATDSRRRPSITPISPCGSRCPTGWTR